MTFTRPLFLPARRNQLPNEDSFWLLAPTTLPESTPALSRLRRSFCHCPATNRRPSLVQYLSARRTILGSVAPNYCPTFESELSLFSLLLCIYKEDTTKRLKAAKGL